MAVPALKRLFTPLTVGSLVLPNRIIMPALHLVYCADGEVNDRLVAFYARRAQGGAGLLIAGGCSIDRLGCSARMIGLHELRFGPGLRRLTGAVHQAGGRIAAQLFQSGRYAKPAVTGRAGIAPSAVYSHYSRHTPEAMTRAQIDETVVRFRDAAALAADSGFDAVEILAGAGYLLSEFLSPLTNLREDEFGGTQQNRFRFPGMVLDAVRQAVGPGFPILVRLAGNEFVPGGNGSAEAAAFARFLEERGADALNVTGGWHETGVPQLTGHLPAAGFAYLAATVRSEVDIPMFASNRINNPLQAERLVALGMADAVCMGRQLVCDPDTPRKAREGRSDEIIPCVACGQGCTDHTFAGKALGCALNPLSGHEYRVAVTPAQKPLRVLVAGGGAAGISAAVIAAKRGHQVTLFEQGASLGGRLRALAALAANREYGRLLAALEQSLRHYGAEVRLNEALTAPHAAALGADIVLVATGASPLLPVDAAGFSGTVCTDEEVLSGSVIPGRQVVVLGSGGLELETALYLKQDAAPSAELLEFLARHTAEPPETIAAMRNHSPREVLVVTPGEKPAAHIGIGTRWVMNKELKLYGVDTLHSARPVRILPEGISVSLPDGGSRLLPADTIVTTARAPERGLAQALAAAHIPCRMTGDALKTGSKAYVVGAAVRLAMGI